MSSTRARGGGGGGTQLATMGQCRAGAAVAAVTLWWLTGCAGAVWLELATTAIKCISEDISAAESLVDELDALDAKLSNEEEGRAAAILYHDKMAPMLEEIRSHVDSLEMMVDDQMWPLPKYRELLFIH